MILKFLLTILITLALLTGKAWFDVYRQEKNRIYTSHSLEWILLAGFIGSLSVFCISFTATVFNWQLIRLNLADLLILLPISWIYFDFIHNVFTKMPYDYIAAPTVHSSLTDLFINWVGRRWQYELKFGVLIIIVVICYLILKS